MRTSLLFCAIGALLYSRDAHAQPNTCQVLSDRYGIVHGLGWGTAPVSVQNDWRAMGCAARPAPDRVRALCREWMVTFGIVPGRTFGSAPLDVQASWRGMRCGTPPPAGAPPAAVPESLTREPAARFTGETACPVEGESGAVCQRVRYDTTRNAAFGLELGPAISNTPADTTAANLTDGFYGNGSAWRSSTRDAWIKIDLGKRIEVAGVRFGRDRTGGLDDGDPGAFSIFVADSDASFTAGDESRDDTEYRRVFESSGVEFLGTIAGAETLRATFARTSARFIKLRVANQGAVIDEVEVVRAPSFSTQYATPARGRGPFAKSAVAKNTAPARDPASLNDGRYGDASAWASADANAWIKIDLGRIVSVDRVRFGRDRATGTDDRDPGRFTIAFATNDAVYANGDDAGDEAEYSTAFDSDEVRFGGRIDGPTTLEVGFDARLARFVKIQFAAAGAAIDEVEIESDALSQFVCGVQYYLRSYAGVVERGATPGTKLVRTSNPRNAWIVECTGDGKYELISRAGDYLVRRRGAMRFLTRGPTIITTDPAREPWTIEFLSTDPRTGDTAVLLRSNQNDYLSPMADKSNLTAITAEDWRNAWVLASAVERPLPSSGSRAPGWQCLPGSSMPVRVRGGDLECAANESGCMTGRCDPRATAAQPWILEPGAPRPLVRSCAAGGDEPNGYSTAGHWCAVACASAVECTGLGIEELSRNRPAEQSSCSADSLPDDPARGVDGLISGTFGFQTRSEADPWWSVDLGEIAALSEVRLENRGDCCGERLASLVVEVAGQERVYRAIDLHDRRAATMTGASLTVPLRGATGRFVRVRLADGGALHLDEVTVLGRRARVLPPTSVAKPLRSDLEKSGLPLGRQTSDISLDGSIALMDGRNCLQMQFDPDGSRRLTVAPCSGESPQIWRSLGQKWETDLSVNGSSFCIDVDQTVDGRSALAVNACADADRGQVWRSKNATLESVGSAAACLSGSTAKGVKIVRCSPGDATQRWYWRPQARKIALRRPGQFVRYLAETCTGDRCTVEEIALNPATKSRMAFIQRPGLSDPTALSLELAAKPGHYLAIDGTGAVIVGEVGDPAAATFRYALGLGDARPGLRSLESLARRGEWLQLQNGRLILGRAGTESAGAEATFDVGSFDEPNYVAAAPNYFETLRRVEDGRCLSVDDTVRDGAAVRVKRCHVPGDRERWGLNSAGDYVHKESGLCLTTSRGQCEGMTIRKCTGGVDQRWTMDIQDHLRKLRRGSDCLVLSSERVGLEPCPTDFSSWTAADLTNDLPVESWQCVPGYAFPLRKHLGEIECATRDGRSCMRNTCPVRDDVIGWDAAPNLTIVPLTCGAMHERLHGTDGYSEPGHWCATAARKWHGTDHVVFLSDPQYVWSENSGLTDAEKEAESRRNNEFHIKSVKSLVKDLPPGSLMGVIINGDLTAYGEEDELDFYKEVYEQSGLTIYPGLGNHDYVNSLRDGYWSEVPVADGCYRNTCARRMLNHVQSKIREIQTSNFDDFLTVESYDFPVRVKTRRGSLAYSWDVHDLHFVQLHNFPAFQREFMGWDHDEVEMSEFEITSSMTWLRRDLALARNAGKKIILNMHDATDHFPKERAAEFDKFVRMLDEYSVSAVFAGHIHGECGQASWYPEGPAGYMPKAPLFRSGASTYLNYLLGGFRNDTMTVERVSSVNGEFSRTVIGRYPLFSPKPSPPMPVPGQDGSITFFNAGGYVANFELTFDLPDGRPSQKYKTGRMTLGQQRTYFLPWDATNVRAYGEADTGWPPWGDPWRTIFDEKVEGVPKMCFYAYGTTLDRRSSHRCP